MVQPDSLGQGDTRKGGPNSHVLGLSTDELAGLSVDELTNNKTAITMLMHYYRVLQDDNASLRNELNSTKTYVNGYVQRGTYSRVAAGLSVASNICIGFAVNQLTSSVIWPGLASLIPGLVLAAVSIYYSLRED
jgi:hypothetical protein